MVNHKPVERPGGSFSFLYYIYICLCVSSNHSFSAASKMGSRQSEGRMSSNRTRRARALRVIAPNHPYASPPSGISPSHRRSFNRNRHEANHLLTSCLFILSPSLPLSQRARARPASSSPLGCAVLPRIEVFVCVEPSPFAPSLPPFLVASQRSQQPLQAQTRGGPRPRRGLRGRPGEAPPVCRGWRGPREAGQLSGDAAPARGGEGK